MPYGPALNFYKSLDIKIAGPYSPRRTPAFTIDLSTGKNLSSYIGPTAQETTAALQKWLALIEKWEGQFNPGFWSFWPGAQVPADLLLSFETLAAREGIEAAAPRMAAISGLGVGGLGKRLVLDVVRNFGSPVTRAVLEGSLFVPEGSNSALYDRATSVLGESVRLETRVVLARRDAEKEIRVVIEDKYGERYLVRPKRILVAVQPSLGNLEVLGLDEKEKKVLGSLEPIYSFVGVVTASCIPENVSLAFVDPAAVPRNHVRVRDSEWTLRFDATGLVGGGYFRVLFSTTKTLTDEEVKAKVQGELERVRAAGTLGETGLCKVDWKAFSAHRSVGWGGISAEMVKKGWVEKLYGLQGYRGTWYTGGVWTGIYSSNVWAMTEEVVKRMVVGL